MGNSNGSTFNSGIYPYLILRESVSAISQSLKSSIHLGTKGCLFDFTAFLGDVRHKVLSGFVCNHCRTALVHDGYPELADELILVLDRKWIGELDDPKSPASIARKLGYDLFITKGFTATPWEKFLITLQEESTKQLISIVSSIILILVLIALGLKP
ncbi:hypothetical protein [Candidatus Villigracilis affinis]|uniref:hypothetical protein n=1 Tax=Candidatus Villigracilis affinis TaxID=3140682 RepID=UPI002A1D016C|nr:hypothetical protein [Anaerolineales bacterium]